MYALFRVKQGSAKRLKVLTQGKSVIRVECDGVKFSIKNSEINDGQSEYFDFSYIVAKYKEAKLVNNIYNGIRNAETFHIGSDASFSPATPPEREPDYISPSGSAYWYTVDGVYRNSEIWHSSVEGCDWAVDGEYCIIPEERTGFCAWEDFSISRAARALAKRAHEEYQIWRKILIEAIEQHNGWDPYVNEFINLESI